MAKKQKTKGNKPEQAKPEKLDIDTPDNPLNETGAEPAIQQEIGGSARSKAISMERWQEAQKAEREAHNANPNNNAQHYAETYRKYFKYVELGTNLHGLHVIEIGPAYYPALAICENYAKSAVVEPMLTNELLDFTRGHGVILVDSPLEFLTDDDVKGIIDSMPGTKEIWLFNVLQHVIDPDAFVERCKEIADRIRFFEPVEYPTSTHHPHSFSKHDFIKWFNNGPEDSNSTTVKRYTGGSEPNFHSADCAYGVWVKPK